MTDLYQAVVLDHARHPRNRRKLEGATAVGEGFNHLCGDCCTVYMSVAGGVIRDVSFEGEGCAIMMATASLMTLALCGKTVAQASVIGEQFLALLTTDMPSNDLGDLAALAGVRDYPSRLQCATLPWQGLRLALRQN